MTGIETMCDTTDPDTTVPDTSDPDKTDREPAVAWRLRAGVRSSLSGTTVLVGGDRTASLPLPGATRGTRLLIEALAGPGGTETDLAATVSAADGEQGLLGMHLTLARLCGLGLLDAVLIAGGAADHDELAVLSVVGQGSIRLATRPAADRPLTLDRSVRLSPENGRFLVRAPRSPLQLAVSPQLVPVLAALAGPVSTAELVGQYGSRARELVRLLATAGAIATSNSPESPQRHQWEPADLWLHSLTRSPRTVAGYGGTYRGRGAIDPLPAVPEPRGTTTVALPVPDLEALRHHDPTLTEVVESRRSRRMHDDENPITAAQLGELLYRTARLRKVFGGSDDEQVADRPYPSGGAAHELEIYPLIGNCAGIEPGLWHYRAADHRLELVSEPSNVTAGLVTRARAAAVMQAAPQVVLLIAARFGRVMFKYETIGYSLILKHVGVLYHALYLAGTAMDLAVCALGGGDAELFAAATGLDFYTEGSVGELVIGSPAPGGEDDWRGEVGGP